jgi:hypothetical protein
MKITCEKNVPVPVLSSVTITMTPEQSVQLMLLIGGTNNRQKEAVIFSDDKNENDQAALKYLNLLPVAGETDLADIYRGLSKMFSEIAGNRK